MYVEYVEAKEHDSIISSKEFLTPFSYTKSGEHKWLLFQVQSFLLINVLAITKCNVSTISLKSSSFSLFQGTKVSHRCQISCTDIEEMTT